MTDKPDSRCDVQPVGAAVSMRMSADGPEDTAEYLNNIEKQLLSHLGREGDGQRGEPWKVPHPMEGKETTAKPSVDEHVRAWQKTLGINKT